MLDQQIVERGEELAAIVHITVPRDVLMLPAGRLICRCVAERTIGRSNHRFSLSLRWWAANCINAPTIRRRGAAAHHLLQQTEPLLTWRKRGIVHDIDGNRDVSQVTESIVVDLAPMRFRRTRALTCRFF
jgi:adenylate kinase family enzyme